MNQQDNEEIVNPQVVPEEQKQQISEKEIFADDQRKLKFYEDLRTKVRKWTTSRAGHHGGKMAEYLFILPDLFILVCRLAVDSRVPVKKKLFIGAIITYLILPLDIIPDFIPIIGYLDDLVLVVLGLNQIFNELDKQILIDNWSGEGNVLDVLQTISAQAERFVDKNVLQKIKHWISRKS